jgi:hypothetical protein
MAEERRRLRKIAGGRFIRSLMQNGHIPWKLKRHVCTDFRSRRDEMIKEEMVSELKRHVCMFK